MKTNIVISTITPSLISQLHFLYNQSIKNLLSAKIWHEGINGYSDSAIAVYPLAITTWEAFIYESVLSPFFGEIRNKREINYIPLEIVDKWDIETKSLLIPQLLYGKSFDKGMSIFQDFSALVSIRNSIVHFKFNKPNDKTLKAIDNLYNKNVFLHSPFLKQNNGNITIYDWPKSISSIEGIRWAINTIVKMAKQLNEFVPEDRREFVIKHPLQNFNEITEDDAKRKFIESGVDPS